MTMSSNKPIPRRKRRKTVTGAAAKTESQYELSCKLTTGLFRWLANNKLEFSDLDQKGKEFVVKVTEIYEQWMVYLDDYS